jgi:surface antigen
MRFVKTVWILLISLTLVNCSTGSRSQTSAIVGGATATATCVLSGLDNPFVAAGCALVGAFVGAELAYNDDYDVHNATFVDHLNNGPQGSSYTNWFNEKTGSKGIIHTTTSYMKGPVKCKDYSSTIDIRESFPIMSVGKTPDRSVTHGIVCQMPDGRWVEYE